MKNNLKKWPRNWIEHVTETCFFYFEDTGISFIDSKILCSDRAKDAKIYGIRLTFQKYKNIYDIFINHESSTFIVNYYYKNYYRLKTKNHAEEHFIFMTDTSVKGSDCAGLFNYSDLGGEAAKDSIMSAYDITQSIENTINFHNDKDYDNDGDGGGENDPIEPFSPEGMKEPELLNC